MENGTPDRSADCRRLHLSESAAVPLRRNRHGFPERLYHAVSAGRRGRLSHRDSGCADDGFHPSLFAGSR